MSIFSRATPEEKALREADKAYKRRVKEGERALAAAREGQSVSRVGKVTLYADRVKSDKGELPLLPETKTDVKATGAVTTGKDGKKIDSRELFLVVENERGGLTIKCKPDDSEAVHQLAQQIRLAGPGGPAAAQARERAIEEATAELERIKSDRSDVEAAERALPPERIAKTRRRARFAWVKWAAGAVVAIFVLAAIFGDSSSDKASDDSTTTEAVQPADTSEPTPEPEEFKATNSQVTELVENEMGDGSVRRVDCNRITCIVEFKAREIISRPERETLDQERPIWKKIFDDPKLKEVRLVDYNDATTAGGKSVVSKAHSIQCSREDDEQIDWDNVTTDGLKVICTFLTFLR